MATGKRTSIPVTLEIDDEELEARIELGMTMPNRLFFTLRSRDKRKTDKPPLPISITFRNSKEAHEFIGKAVVWLGHRFPREKEPK